ncbi:HIRAN domain-containing protein [Brachybacterium tyrofermentans]|uniref:HIRAN domain-containing protein n=1 Tax=Brachybacterium tyrofermentans TaxID=47848 RepID=UPI003FD6B715
MGIFVVTTLAVAFVLVMLVLKVRIGRKLGGDEGDTVPPDEREPSGEQVSNERGEPPPSKSPKYLSTEESRYYLVPDASGRMPVRVRGGFFYHEDTRKMVPPGNAQMTAHGVMSFNVRGVSYYEAAAKAANTSPGTEVIFRREPDNKFDENAIAVVGLDNRGKERVVGYVNKGNARRLAKRMDSGESIRGWFMRGSGPRIEPGGIAVVITDEDTKRQLF